MAREEGELGMGLKVAKMEAEEKEESHHHPAARFPAWGLGGAGTGRTKTTDPLNWLGWAPQSSG